MDEKFKLIPSRQMHKTAVDMDEKQPKYIGKESFFDKKISEVSILFIFIIEEFFLININNIKNVKNTKREIVQKSTITLSSFPIRLNFVDMK